MSIRLPFPRRSSPNQPKSSVLTPAAVTNLPMLGGERWESILTSESLEHARLPSPERLADSARPAARASAERKESGGSLRRVICDRPQRRTRSDTCESPDQGVMSRHRTWMLRISAFYHDSAGCLAGDREPEDLRLNRSVQQDLFVLVLRALQSRRPSSLHSGKYRHPCSATLVPRLLSVGSSLVWPRNVCGKYRSLGHSLGPPTARDAVEARHDANSVDFSCLLPKS